MEIPQEEVTRRYRLSFIRTHKSLLRYLLFDKPADQFPKQKHTDTLAAEELLLAV